MEILGLDRFRQRLKIIELIFYIHLRNGEICSCARRHKQNLQQMARIEHESVEEAADMEIV